MRKYEVVNLEHRMINPSSGDNEIIEADFITVTGAYVEFSKDDGDVDIGSRTIAVRMNCNVTEVIE